MKRFQISTARAQYVRALVRAVAVAAAAFGLKLSVDQTAAVYGLTEAVLQLVVTDKAT